MTTNALTLLEKISGKKLTLGNMLWAIRRCDEKTQSDFARELGISNQYLCDLERGRKIISAKKAKGFAEKLGYLPEQFIELALQDMLEHEGIHMKVQLLAA